ncbi:MAG: hypothetical protein Salg2KO_03100 [Salibacteraceae bacterium]
MKKQTHEFAIFDTIPTGVGITQIDKFYIVSHAEATPELKSRFVSNQTPCLRDAPQMRGSSERLRN